MQIVLASALDYAVQDAEVEFPFLRLDLRPGNGGQSGVELGVNQLGPYVLHVLRLVAVLLPNSPASARKGLPSTISCVAVPCLRKWGISEADAARTPARAREAARVEQNRVRRFMILVAC